MFTLAAALALAAREATLPEDPPATDLCALPGEDAAAVRGGWAMIDAREMYSLTDLADALKAAPAGKRRVVRGGSFSGADMRALAPLLANACLVETELDGTHWEGTTIPGLRLVNIDFTGAKAARARWPGLSTHGVNLQGSDFTGADLSGLRFVAARQGADFDGVSLRAANLAGASFACGITIDVWCVNGPPDFVGADLTGADLSSLGLWDPKAIAGAVLDDAIVSPTSLFYLEEARITRGLRLADSFTSPYPSEPDQAPQEPVVVAITAAEARALIDATRAEQRANDDRPSFDCAKAAAPVEKLLCGEYESGLRALDRDLADAWAAARAAGKGDLAAQRRWLAARAKCGDDGGCIADLYQARIAVLRGALGPGIALRPGASVTYDDDPLPLPEAMRTGELYTRILPALRAAGRQSITLTGNPDGSLAVEGFAVGANAHSCGLGAEATRFDPATGWWSATGEGGRKVPLFRIEGRRIVLRYSGNMGDTSEEASEFISCGARASFDGGIDLSPR